MASPSFFPGVSNLLRSFRVALQLRFSMIRRTDFTFLNFHTPSAPDLMRSFLEFSFPSFKNQLSSTLLIYSIIILPQVQGAGSPSKVMVSVNSDRTRYTPHKHGFLR